MTQTMRVDMIQACILAESVKTILITGTDALGKPYSQETKSPVFAEACANGIAWAPGLKEVDLLMTVAFKDRSAGAWKLTKF